MKYNNIEIIRKGKKEYDIKLSNDIVQRLSGDMKNINSIFWYPIVETDVNKFKDRLKAHDFADFPLEVLVRSVILYGTYYWVNKALDWYLNIDSYDKKINEKLLEIFKINRVISQKFKQNINRVLTKKYRLKSNELYEENKNSKVNFVQSLKEHNIPFKDLSSHNLIIVRGSKYFW